MTQDTLAGPFLWDTLAALVGIDTATGSSTMACAQLMADRLDRTGWHVVIDPPAGPVGPSVLAWTGPPEPDGLILSAHMDVVPWAQQPGWTGHPLALRRLGDRALGRGVADMKGFLAQCLVLAATMDGSRLRRPLALVFTSDEEIGCLGARHLAPRLAELLAPLPLPSRAVIGEPTGGRAYRAHKGHVHMTVTVRGRGGHSSRPDLGCNAIAAMSAVINVIEAVAAETAARTPDEALRLFPEHPAVPFNLGVIEGGTADNMIADRCSLTFDFRPGPGTDAEALVTTIETRAREAVTTCFPGAVLAVDEVVLTPAMTSPDSGALPEALRRLTAQADLAGAPYATDGGHLARAGIASYIWGPGELEQAHRPDESISVPVLEESLRRLQWLVGALCT